MRDFAWHKIEVKETSGFGSPCSPPKPGHYPWDSDAIFGIWYPESPGGMRSTDAAYELSLRARYYQYDREERKWLDIGGPDAFLQRLVEVTRMGGFSDWEISWPEPFANHFEFGNPDEYQVHPWGELIRRHFDQRAYRADRDAIIEKTYRRPRSQIAP